MFELFKKALLVRRVEEFVAECAKDKLIDLPIHLSIGQELFSVALCDVISDEDYVWGTYRSHALYIARSGDLVSFFAELLGNSGGCSAGLGGSMHLHSIKHKIIGASGIVGTHISNAVGFAYGQKLQNNNNLTCAVFGDGATDTGVFYESLNIAALKNVPMMFLLEDNNLAIRTPLNTRQNNTQIINKVREFGIKTFKSQNDFESIIKTIKEAYTYSKSKHLPSFVQVNTIRWYQHLGFEYELNKSYRDYLSEENIQLQDEINIWKKNLDKSVLDNIESEIKNSISSSWELAKSFNYPDISKIYENVK